MGIPLHLLVCFGPPLLMAMGVTLSFACRMEMRHAYWIGLVAFLVVGIPVSAAAFLETLPTGASNDGVTGSDVTRGTVATPGMRHAQPHRSKANKGEFVIHHLAHEANKVAANNQAAIPRNTLSCTGFTKDPDGTWEAGDDTRPFDVASSTNYVIRDQGPIPPSYVSVGDIDLYALLNAKCGTAARSHR